MGLLDRDLDVEDAGGERRTRVEQYQVEIDWTSPEAARRYLGLASEVLEHYPEDTDEPSSAGRALRRALGRAELVGPDGAILVSSTASPAAGIPASSPRPELDGVWTPGRLRVFLSHVNQHRVAVAELATGLESLRWSPFVAHMDIQPSQPWQRTIERALSSCDVLVAYTTPDFSGSDWTDQEVGWVLGRGVLVTPVNVGRQPYGFFGSYQSVPGSGVAVWPLTYAVFRAIVFAVLRERRGSDPGLEELVARTVVGGFCQSPSHDGTRNRFPFLSMVPLELWTEDMVDELESAAEFNPQINDAGLYEPRLTAPEAIGQLIARIPRGEQP